MSAMTPTQLQVEYRANPMGVDTPKPRLSWLLVSPERGQRQTAYQVLVASSPQILAEDRGDLWDSGRVESEQTAQVAYGGKALASRQPCWWKVRSWDRNAEVSPYSEPARWGMGLLEPGDWRAQWIGGELSPENAPPEPGKEPKGGKLDSQIQFIPSPHLRKEFEATAPVARATVYATAQGLFELYLNGARVGEDLLAPGWTDFNQRVLYHAYDVTAQVRQGGNAFGAILACGWYAGYLGWDTRTRGHYGRTPRLLAQLEIEYADGHIDTITSDETWRFANGPILGADLYMGEQYDARRELGDWATPGYGASEWRPVVVHESQPVRLQAYPGAPTRRMLELKPQSVKNPAPGVYRFDMGQNMVGWARIRVKGPAGAKIALRFAEILEPDGSLYLDNLRSARCVDEYWLRGDGLETYEPRFTFHGFRYVEVLDAPCELGLDDITGVVVHADMPLTGRFTCSHPMINQLQHNIEWGQRGNFLEVPTDCPQRDERLGWMGDAQIFVRTACFNMNTAAFYTKWMDDVDEARLPEGEYSDVAPRMVDLRGSAPAWADAGVIVPWTLYQCYGDTGILERHYDAMKKWVDYLDAANPNHLWLEERGNDFGDWLSINAETPKEVIATAYFAYTSGILAKIAAVLGKEEDARHYTGLYEQIRLNFQQSYVTMDGKVHGESQTAYVLALHFGLLPSSLREKAANYLVEDIRARDMHLSTGFVGCSYLPFALSNTGHLDVAYRLLLNDTFPSWGYPIKYGATTIWERWDGWTDDRGPQDPGMNSYNHYAYGAVGDWMYRVVAGLDLEEPGYRRISIRPRPGGGFTHASAEYDSIRGPIKSAWRIENGQFLLDVVVPVGAQAKVYVPASSADSVQESGRPASEAEGVANIGWQDVAAVFEVGSGEYHFSAPVVITS